MNKTHNTAALTQEPVNGIKATLCHDEGAIARCAYCGRYTLDHRALGNNGHACKCGKTHGWSGSFIKPGPAAKWSGDAPQPAASVASGVDGLGELHDALFLAQRLPPGEAQTEAITRARILLSQHRSKSQPAAGTDDLVIAIHTLASHFENALWAFGNDAEALKKAKGDIAHALNIAAAAQLQPRTPAEPGINPDHKQLMRFYAVSTTDELIEAQSYHIEKLQAKVPACDVPAIQHVREG